MAFMARCEALCLDPYRQVRFSPLIRISRVWGTEIIQIFKASRGFLLHHTPISLMLTFGLSLKARQATMLASGEGQGHV